MAEKRSFSIDDFDDALYKVVVERNEAVVKKFLTSIDVQNETLRPALTSSFLEAACRDAAILRHFLDVNFDVNATDEDGDTALMFAARGEDTYVYDDVVNEEDTAGESEPPLMDPPPFTESLHNVEQLLAHGGVDINMANNVPSTYPIPSAHPSTRQAGETALIQAMMIGGQPEIVQRLLDAKCDVTLADQKGYTALHYAAVRGQLDNVRMLLQADNIDIHAKTKDGDSVIYLACTSGNTSVVDEILKWNPDINAANNDNQTPLMTAAIFSSIEIVAKLISCGADVTIRDAFGMTALHHAVYCGAKLEVVQCLVDAKSDVNNATDDEMKNTILHDAITGTTVQVAEYLINQGAAVNALNSENKTPAMLAKQVDRDDMIEMLVQHGAELAP
ncbi:unnamed protein product [Aphanomyces euteiches]